LHDQASEQWELLQTAGARLTTSAPVVIETFAFLDRNAGRDVAMTWKGEIDKPGVVTLTTCELADLALAWEYFRRSDLHKLSAVDATSFAIMRREQIRVAYAFDHHFAMVGFSPVG
jgi:uncharacterized protein